MSTSTSKLFQPIQVGDVALKHRVVLAPLSRFRADKDHVPGPHHVEYYRQRSTTPGTLLITEATFIAPQAAGFRGPPGIWSDAQIESWKKVTDAVHANGSFIYLQLWALGRAALPSQLASEDPTFPYVSASDVPLVNRPLSHLPKTAAGLTHERPIEIPPRPLTVAEIQAYIQLYVTAAKNAVFDAGFDGVEVHSANGYLLDQFLQDVSNRRTDEYGGSPEGRSRFTLEVVDAVTKAVGEKKTGIRISPWNTYQDMRMRDPIPTFSHLVTKIRYEHPDLAYVHVIEPGVDAAGIDEDAIEGESNDFIRKIWAGKPLISAGGYDRASGIKTADTKGDLIAYGREFIHNPDLPIRLEHGFPLNRGDRDTYYHPLGSANPVGYTSYPFYKA